MSTLGGVRQGDGARFATVSRHAHAVTLCLFDEERETAQVGMTRSLHDLWECTIPRCASGQRYGFRVEGPYAPEQGHYFNPARLLIDPAARGLAGDFVWHPSVMTVSPAEPDFARDSAPYVPKSIIAEPDTPVIDTRPRIPWTDTLIYETHVKAMTHLHPDVEADHRGRYEGLSSPCIIDHLKALQVTTLELMPVQWFIDENPLLDKGLRNAWGYNPLAWSVPAPRYARENAVIELKQTIQRLHAAGIEVLLDLVFNHTAEADGRGPTISWRGLDNASFYRCEGARYLNDSGCGNTLAFEHPASIRLLLDSLRHWALAYDVDGFRLDLATVIARTSRGFDAAHPVLASIMQDPVLCDRKWIVEPWDLGHGGYQLGQFPPFFLQWNDQCRDQIRRVIRRDAGQCAGLARRLGGSWDIFTRPGSHGWNGVNMIAAHDGYTLADLVTYTRKYNQANGEDNQDGHSENLSDNHGCEGPTEDPVILSRRALTQRNALGLLAVAQGVPMLSYGHEGGRTQGGNNNPYCQDNPLTWCPWPLPDAALQAFTRHVFGLRRTLRLSQVYDPMTEPWQQVNHRLRFFDLDGAPMTEGHWQTWACRSLAMVMKTPVTDVLLLSHFGDTDAAFRLPPSSSGGWQCVLDTVRDPLGALGGRREPGASWRMAPGSVALFRGWAVSP